jgi:hypothetical protein
MKMTQSNQILEYLEKCGPLTQYEALNLFGVMRLASRVFELRCEGHNIVSEKKAVTNRHGDECFISSYRLIGERNE